MPTALLSSFQNSPRLAEFAHQLATNGWQVIVDPNNEEFFKELGVPFIPLMTMMAWGRGEILVNELQRGLSVPDSPEARAIAEEWFIDLLVVDCQPLGEVVYREDVANRYPVIRETFRAWAISAAIMGFRPVVIDLKDLDRVEGWISRHELNGRNLRWLWAKAQMFLALRHTELAKIVSYGTAPSGMVIGAGLPAPDSEEWLVACSRKWDAITK